MADAPKTRTIYIGQLPLGEIGLATSAARELGFAVAATYGEGTYSDITPTDKQIKVDPGNYGVLLSYPEDKDAGGFWDKFFELKEAGSSSKEAE